MCSHQNGTSYTNAEELEITTLDDVIYLSEHQSTYNPNIPLRGLIYFARLYEAIARAMDDCIEKNVLADILLKCKSEVFHMLLTEYDEKKHLRHVKEEGREEKSIEIAKKMLQKGEGRVPA